MKVSSFSILREPALVLQQLYPTHTRREKQDLILFFFFRFLKISSKISSCTRRRIFENYRMNVLNYFIAKISIF